VRRVALAAIAVLLAGLIRSAPAMPPTPRTAVLSRGINITGWFRFPASRDPAALRAWLSDAAIAGIRRAGFTFVRLAVDPVVVDPALANSGHANSGVGNFGLANPSPANPSPANSGRANPGRANPGLADSGFVNSRLANSGLANPVLANLSPANPNLVNLILGNPGPANPRLANSNLANSGVGYPGAANPVGAAPAGSVQAGVDPTPAQRAEAVGAAMRQVLLEQVKRLQAHGLAVIVSPHPVTWNLDTDAGDRERLVAFWRGLAPALRALPAALTFPEVVNEPVFHADPAAWPRLQEQVRAVIRAALPDATIVLTGSDWGSIGGLLSLTPGADDNVVYSFHFYDPAELTSLAAYRPALDREALARLPFPEMAEADCGTIANGAGDRVTREVMLFYCATNWDAAHVRDRLRQAAEWGRRHGAALLAGEFGASARLNSDARLAWLGLVRETCAAEGIGWALWGYDDVMGFDIRRPPPNNPTLDRSVLKVLGMPGS
jgi:hypothetical protein